ncbi:MAG: DUF4430 domain-containing protein [Clostridium sp.]
MEKDKKEKQKKVFLLSLVFIILLFGTFVTVAVKFVNSDNNKDKISTKTPIISTASISKEKVESNIIESDTIESSTISISTESAKDNKEEVTKSDEEDKKIVEQNTNEGKEEVNTEKKNSQQSTSKEDTSLNNSSNVSNNNSSNNGSSNNNSSNEKNNNEEIKKDEEDREEEKPKFIVNINIKMVDNTILSSQIALDNEVNAFEALKYYCESNSIQLGYTGSGKLAYVNSINGIKEKSEGPSSGWMYKVNGVFPNISAGRYDLSSNDTLEWVFTKDGGKDVGER